MATLILCVFAKLCFIAEAENSLYDLTKKINKLLRYRVITNNICPPETALGTLTCHKITKSYMKKWPRT